MCDERVRRMAEDFPREFAKRPGTLLKVTADLNLSASLLRFDIFDAGP